MLCMERCVRSGPKKLTKHITKEPNGFNTFYVQYTAHKNDLNPEKDQNSFNSL